MSAFWGQVDNALHYTTNKDINIPFINISHRKKVFLNANDDVLTF